MDGDVLIDPEASLQPRRQVVIVFPPLGGQRVNLGRQLYENDRVFRETIQKIDEYTAHLLPVRLVEVLYPGARDEAMYAAVMQQPQYSLLSTFAIEVALAMSCKANLREEDELYATLGHSVGEFASAVISGAFSLESATALVCERGRLMEQHPTRGSMMAVRASSTDANRAIDRAGERGRVVVACDNGPRAAVLSGVWGALSTVLQGLAPGVQVTRVSATHADHSPAMAPLAALLGAYAVQLYAQEKPQSPVRGALGVDRHRACDGRGECHRSDALVAAFHRARALPGRAEHASQGLLRDGSPHRRPGDGRGHARALWSTHLHRVRRRRLALCTGCRRMGSTPSRWSATSSTRSSTLASSRPEMGRWCGCSPPSPEAGPRARVQERCFSHVFIPFLTCHE